MMSIEPHEKQTQMRLRALSASLLGRGVSVLHQDKDQRFDLVENPPVDWRPDNLLGLRDHEILPEPLARQFADAIGLCLRTGEAQVIEFKLANGTERRDFQARMLPDEDGVTTILADVTEERNREVALTSLLREVSHRSKNLLAIVQSVAMQTARHSEGIQDFLSKFRGRLHALSGAQDLVTESNWRGTYLQSLVTSQLSRIGHGALAHMRVTGDNPLLGPNASLHIGLAIHELAANAVLHGALAEGRAGNVWVDARIEENPDHPGSLVIEWQETGIDAGRARQEPRFGTLVLERIVPLSVGGSADYTITADSVRYRLVVPADQFEP